MPVPPHFNYDMWLGSTPQVAYTEKRVHPQVGYERPGWLRCEQFGAGMITGWGAHHIDTAHWGMGAEHTGPIEIWGKAEFPKSGIWDVHGAFRTEARYADGVQMIVSDSIQNGVKFIGTEGWIFVNRVSGLGGSAPNAYVGNPKALDASDRKILTSVIGPDEIHLIDSKDHHGNWLEAIRSRALPLAPAEVGHRSCSACLLHHMAMRAGRTLKWDPARERFHNDDEANGWLSRPQRHPYIITEPAGWQAAAYLRHGGSRSDAPSARLFTAGLSRLSPRWKARISRRRSSRGRLPYQSAATIQHSDPGTSKPCTHDAH